MKRANQVVVATVVVAVVAVVISISSNRQLVPSEHEDTVTTTAAIHDNKTPAPRKMAAKPKQAAAKTDVLPTSWQSEGGQKILNKACDAASGAVYDKLKINVACDWHYDFGPDHPALLQFYISADEWQEKRAEERGLTRDAIQLTGMTGMQDVRGIDVIFARGIREVVVGDEVSKYDNENHL